MSNNTSLHANPFLASFQLLAWLLVHPSAWRAYVSSIDPDWPPDFALARIAPQSWHHPQLRRLGYIALVQSLQVGVLIGIVLSFLWIAGKLNNPLPDIVFGVTSGISLCLIAGLFGSFTISLPFGWIAGVLSGLSVGILLGIRISDGDVWGIVGGAFALSAGGSVTANLSPQILYEKTLGWRIGSFIIGILVGIVVLVIVLGVGLYLLGYYILPQELGIIDNKYLPIVGMAVSVGITLGWFLKDWRLALRLGILFGGIIAGLLIINNDLLAKLTENTISKRFLSGPTTGILYGISFTTMFALPYLIARHIATVWAGVVAGLLGTGVIFFVVQFLTSSETNHQTYLLITWSMVVFMLGLGQQWWLSVLSYPFESAWNLLLYRKMVREPERAVELLRWHSAFWNEHQRSRLLGLDKMLVMAHKCDPIATEEAIVQLSHGHQSWAVKASQIEADTQHLEDCKTVREIADVHEKLMASNELTESEDKWLRSFVEDSRKVKKALLQLNSYRQHTGLEKVIDGLQQRFLLVSENRKQDTIDVQRFRDIATKWEQILTEYAKKLLTTQSLPNPYVVAIPLNEAHFDNIFQKRTEVGLQIERLVSNPYCPPLLLYGQRRIGKTSLLKNLGRILPPQIIRVFIDGQESFKPVHSYVSFFCRLGRAMSNAMSNAKPPVTDVPSLTEETLQTDPFTRFDEWLDQVEQVLGNRSLLLTLDEFVVLEEEFAQGRLERAAVLGKFRSIIQHRPRFRLLFSGTHTFAELQHWANYFINVQTIHLSYLTTEEARKLIEQPVVDFPLHYLPAASQRVMTLTRGHPAFVQMMCSHIVQLKDRQAIDERLLVQVHEVEATITDVLKTSQFLFAEIEHNQVDAKGREMLRWIAATGEGVAVSKSSLQMQFPEELEKTLALLLQRELIEEVEDGYRFQVELVRQWFVLSG